MFCSNVKYYQNLSWDNQNNYLLYFQGSISTLFYAKERALVTLFNLLKNADLNPKKEIKEIIFCIHLNYCNDNK